MALFVGIEVGLPITTETGARSSRKLVQPAIGDRSVRGTAWPFRAKARGDLCLPRGQKVKHHWSKSEAKRPNNELRNSLHGEYPLWRLEKSFAA